MNATLEAPNGLEVTALTFDLATHNGEVTITNPATGDHRTFRIRTILRDGALTGRRMIELLTGPDNGNDYQGFAFVTEDGRARVWRKFRGADGKRSAWEVFARMLERPADWSAKRGMEYAISGRCRRCNRLLTTPESISSGIGPTCAGRE